MRVKRDALPSAPTVPPITKSISNKEAANAVTGLAAMFCASIRDSSIVSMRLCNSSVLRESRRKSSSSSLKSPCRGFNAFRESKPGSEGILKNWIPRIILASTLSLNVEAIVCSCVIGFFFSSSSAGTV